MLDRGRHFQPLRRLVFARDHDIHVVTAPETVVPDRQQAVGIRRKINAHYRRLLVHHMIEKAGVLVGKAVVGLLPDMRGEQIVERGNLPPPRQFRGDFQPLCVLVEHRIDDMNESLVAVEQPVPTREKVSLEPTFTLMLAEHLHYPTVGCKELIVLLRSRFPLPVCDFKHRIQTIGKRFVRTEDPEVSLFLIEVGHVAQELSQHMCVGSLGPIPVTAASPRSSRKSGMSRSRSSNPPFACGFAPILRSPFGANSASSGLSRPSSSKSSSGL